MTPNGGVPVVGCVDHFPETRENSCTVEVTLLFSFTIMYSEVNQTDNQPTDTGSLLLQ